MDNLIEKIIIDTIKAFEVGVHPDFIKWALLVEGHTDRRADLIMLWAKQFLKKEKEQKTIVDQDGLIY
jgi:hypothetical protein